nr:CPBP family intramembrane metalloprotease [candidate division Zixibacteria bacterium]
MRFNVRNIIKSNNLILYLIILISISGFLGNYFMHYFQSSDILGDNIYITAVSIVYFLLVIILILISVFRYNKNLTGFGFVLNKGCYLSIGIIILVSIILTSRNIPTIFLTNISLYIGILQASLEEIIFRVLLIQCLIKIFGVYKYKILHAIIVGSLIFTLIHVPIREFGIIINIFIVSVVLAYIYYFTQSIILPIYIHTLVNTYSYYELSGGIIVLLFYIILAMSARILNHNVKMQQTG